MKLILKVTLAITALLFATMIPFIYLNVRSIRTLLYEEAALGADIVSETIIRTTRRQMLENDCESLHETIREAGSQQGVLYISVFNAKGSLTFSTDKERAHRDLATSAAAKEARDGWDSLWEKSAPMKRSRVFPDENGREMLSIAKAIFNDKGCYSAACHYHPADQSVLGVLDTVVTLDNMRAQTWQYLRRLIPLTFSMLFLIGAILTFLIRREVTAPISELLAHTKKIGALEFGEEIAPRGKDEIGDLAQSFNEMSRKLNLATRELEAWGRTLEQKVEERTAELKSMQAQLIQSEKLASLGEIVAGIAHELNNPLTGVIVLSTLLERDKTLNETHKADVASILHESTRCSRIVKGLLEFSRVTSPQKLMLCVNTVLDDTLALIGTQSIFHDVTIRKNYDPGLPETLIDPNQMQQVFINILINAGQAMPDGGFLEISTRAESNQVLVSVKDTGCGIPQEHISRIFDPFFTTKGSSGTGLGLSVSYGIVESHAGTINVISHSGHGTEFTIRLPLAVST